MVGLATRIIGSRPKGHGGDGSQGPNLKSQMHLGAVGEPQVSNFRLVTDTDRSHTDEFNKGLSGFREEQTKFLRAYRELLVALREQVRTGAEDGARLTELTTEVKEYPHFVTQRLWQVAPIILRRVNSSSDRNGAEVGGTIARLDFLAKVLNQIEPESPCSNFRNLKYLVTYNLNSLRKRLAAQKSKETLLSQNRNTQFCCSLKL